MWLLLLTPSSVSIDRDENTVQVIRLHEMQRAKRNDFAELAREMMSTGMVIQTFECCAKPAVKMALNLFSPSNMISWKHFDESVDFNLAKFQNISADCCWAVRRISFLVFAIC